MATKQRMFDKISVRLLVVIGGSFLFVNASAAEENEKKPSPFRISLIQQGENDHVVAVNGFTTKQLADLKKVDWNSSDALRVFVGAVENASDVKHGDVKHGENRRGMLGEVHLENNRLVFTPRFRLRPGVEYTAVFRPETALHTSLEKNRSRPIIRTFSLPKPESPPTSIREVYPTSKFLPENQLKFYIYFSAPMSRGEAYKNITLLDEAGKPVADPFLELGEELWDASGQRFTLFFDPGRIKRGLKPREEVGPALIEGKRYTLLISRNWRDAAGNPLQQEFRKTFDVSPPDDEQPNVDKWKVTPPIAETQKPLTVVFSEPLDYAMLQRVLVVEDKTGNALAGSVQVDHGETRWRFTPSTSWEEGAYSLVVKTALEDRAGNSIARPFEVDIFRKVDQTTGRENVRLSFQVQ